ncbi:cupin domain-containing protein [Phyllobacterium sophorae]|uniref:Cupin n=1 Tax=Phyllobacterium sophorae TaxID=1520277 RepID=A0A2P7BF55_9HYPH|nr:cupin domain-containing protein [Phyllobacterium sophorae]PSH65100.1 cupin [Phyllobacterium sophorae]
MSNTKLFAQPDEVAWTVLDNGNRRRVVVYTDELMQVEFDFEAGAIGAMHSHPHVQASYVAEGRFEVTIDGKSAVIGKGGSFIVPSGALHGVKALETGRLIDTFTPHRSDFLDA